MLRERSIKTKMSRASSAPLVKNKKNQQKKRGKEDNISPPLFSGSALIRSGSSGNHAVRASARCTITSGSSGYYRIIFLRFLRFGLR